MQRRKKNNVGTTLGSEVAMCYRRVTSVPWVGHTWLDTLSDACYSSVSTPTGPLPQGMLSYGGFLFPLEA